MRIVVTQAQANAIASVQYQLAIEVAKWSEREIHMAPYDEWVNNRAKEIIEGGAHEEEFDLLWASK